MSAAEDYLQFLSSMECMSSALMDLSGFVG
jgi:hypothetical protein